jgi:DNA primase
VRIKEDIKSRLMPSKIIGQKVNLKQKTSGEFLGLCPFHNEKTPSFSVSDNKKFYHCFGCGEHGDIFEFLVKTTGMQYQDALERLAAEAGVTIPKKREIAAVDRKIKVMESIYEEATVFFEKALREPVGRSALKYVKDRKLSEETIKEFRLGFAPIDIRSFIEYMHSKFTQSDLLESKLFMKSPKGEVFCLFRNRVIFPISSLQGKTIAFGGRAMSDEMKPKYINSTDTPLFKKGEGLYSLNRAKVNIKTTGAIVVVEGYMDVISMYQAGFKAAVAPLGTALKSQQIEMLWNYCAEPILCMDGDVAGKKAAFKSALCVLPIISADKSIKIAQVNGAKDPDELISISGSTGMANVLKDSKVLSQYIFDYMRSDYNLKVPEDVVKLKSDLATIAESVGDTSIKREFDQFFKNKLFESKRLNFKSNKDSSQNAANIMAAIRHELNHSKDILNVISYFPEILADNAILEQFINLNFEDAKMDFHRRDILNKFEAQDFSKHSDLEAVKYPDLQIKTVEEAKVCVIRLFRLNNLEMITEEINYLVDELNKHPDQSVFIRLTHLKQAEEELKKDLGII